MNDFFDTSLCNEFRKAINGSTIWSHEECYREQYNLFCAVMDRIDSCTSYLNKHSATPETETDFLVFLMFGCMVLDAIKQVLDNLGLPYEFDTGNKASYQYFKKYCMNYPLELKSEVCPTDDKFFEYFRSITFAHPFETSRPKFFQKGEVQYSPWVIAKSIYRTLGKPKDAVGVRIYSNKFDEIKDLVISFSTLKNYIRSRYSLLYLATNEINQISEAKIAEWKQEKVNRTLSPIDTLKDIKRILDMRHESNSNIEEAILYLSCETTLPKNSYIVKKYRSKIKSIIPALCNAVDAMDYEMSEKLLSTVLHACPRNIHHMAFYQLEKIYSYLNNEQGPSNVEWGLAQAEAFAAEFAGKWVVITPKEMTFEEIKLLVSAACYFETLFQQKEGNK